MFIGEYSHSVDAKGRLILPSRFREELGAECVVAKGYDGCLSVYTMEEWDGFVASLTKLSPHNPDARRVLRLLSAGATPCELDKQGRINIPANLREHADICGDKVEVVVVGALSKIEVWSQARWKEYNEGEGSITLEQAGANLAGMGL